MSHHWVRAESGSPTRWTVWDPKSKKFETITDSRLGKERHEQITIEWKKGKNVKNKLVLDLDDDYKITFGKGCKG